MPKKTPAVRSEQQRRKSKSNSAAKAEAHRDSPQDIAEGALMKRQGKHMHQKDGKG